MPINPDHLSEQWLGRDVPLTTYEGRVIADWFNELHSGRAYGWGHPQPLAWSEMLAWSKLTKRKLSAWVITLIRCTDNLYMKAQAEEANNEKGA